MEFPFGRQTSKDSLLNKTGEAGRAIRSSITSGSSRLFGSVMSKKNGIFDGISSGISNTFDQVMTIGGGKEDDEEEAKELESPSSAPATQHEKPKPSPQLPPPPKPQPQQRMSPTTKGSVLGPQRPPPPPARPRRPPAPSRNKSNGSVRGQPGTGKFARQQTAPADFDPSGTSDITFNVDEPGYGRQYSLRSGSVDLDHDSGFQDISNYGGGSSTSPPEITGTRISRNPFLNDPIPDQEYSTVFTEAEVYTGNTDKSNYPGEYTYGSAPRSVSELDPIQASRMAPGFAGLGSDLLPGIPRVPSNNTALLAPQMTTGRDLLAITPTSGEALPMPSLEPTRHIDPDEIYDDSDGDSEATEGCDEEPDPEDYGGAEYDYGTEVPMFRSGSVGSDKSWHSNQSTDSQLDDTARACRDFMKEFVSKVFSSLAGVTQADKAQYGQFCQHSPGRLWFARHVNAQRVNSKKVEEDVFYSLVQYFAVALFECNEADDFGPAKILMNMCFTFYHEVQPPTGPTLKHFLYSYLKDQPIWQSLRFWNAAFFDAVQHERARKPMPTRGTGQEGQTDDRYYQENITFGQLGTFTCNMRAFGLSKELCLEFIRKQSTIANLRDEQIQMLRENIER